MSVDNAAFLALFWDLASDDAVKRVYGGAQVVDHVRKGEQLFIQRRGGHSVEGELAADTDYTLKRLIRGLGSSRDSARHGFATCLCELLSLPSIPVKYSMTQIEELTKIKSSLKPHEQRDLIFGKLFAYLALIRSGPHCSHRRQGKRWQNSRWLPAGSNGYHVWGGPQELRRYFKG